MIAGKIHENMALIGTIDPQTITTSEIFTDVIDVADFSKVMVTFLTGNMAAEDVTCRVVTCDSAGNNAAALKTATTLAGHATNNDNKQIIIEIDCDELAEGGTNANRYIKGGAVSAGSGGAMAAVVHGIPRHLPGTNVDLTSIAEIETDLD